MVARLGGGEPLGQGPRGPGLRGTTVRQWWPGGARKALPAWRTTSAGRTNRRGPCRGIGGGRSPGCGPSGGAHQQLPRRWSARCRQSRTCRGGWGWPGSGPSRRSPWSTAPSTTAVLAAATRWIARPGGGQTGDHNRFRRQEAQGAVSEPALGAGPAARVDPALPPQTNGKAERFIRTCLASWAYAAAYRTSLQRAQALPDWLRYDNTERHQTALGFTTPRRRLAEIRHRCTMSTPIAPSTPRM